MFSYNYFKYLRNLKNRKRVRPFKNDETNINVNTNYIYEDSTTPLYDQIRYDNIIYDSFSTRNNDVMHETPFTKFCDISFNNSETFLERYDSLKTDPTNSLSI